MEPKFPYIVNYKNGLSFVTKKNSLNIANYLSIEETKKESIGIAFDNSGHSWNYKYVPLKKDWKYKFLSPIINLSCEIEIEWINKKTYSLQELKTIIINCLEKDTDILTQFYEKETLTKIVIESKSFEELLLIFNKPDY
jgi:spore coat polysaccharide biosynthesis protein SpsF (cytidylyltransferase family)